MISGAPERVPRVSCLAEGSANKCRHARPLVGHDHIGPSEHIKRHDVVDTAQRVTVATGVTDKHVTGQPALVKRATGHDVAEVNRVQGNVCKGHVRGGNVVLRHAVATLRADVALCSGKPHPKRGLSLRGRLGASAHGIPAVALAREVGKVGNGVFGERHERNLAHITYPLGVKQGVLDHQKRFSKPLTLYPALWDNPAHPNVYPEGRHSTP